MSEEGTASLVVPPKFFGEEFSFLRGEFPFAVESDAKGVFWERFVLKESGVDGDFEGFNIRTMVAGLGVFVGGKSEKKEGVSRSIQDSMRFWESF
ncbi:MAG: hypothetical protein ACJAT6_000628 [Akkermansiaceae bacterium]|jgi:hypothetical protein|tara:strand:- start:63 stop:347 length:285 start_codon:yes stop_codon:yes gene_type:complete